MNKLKPFKGQHVTVKSFPVATIRSMKHYIKLTLENNQPDKIILNVRINYLSSVKNAKEIDSKVIVIVDLCIRLNMDIVV